MVFIGNKRKETIIEPEKKIKAFQLDIGHVTMVLSLFASANKMKGVVDSDKLLDFLQLNQDDYDAFALAFSLDIKNNNSNKFKY